MKSRRDIFSYLACFVAKQFLLSSLALVCDAIAAASMTITIAVIIARIVIFHAGLNVVVGQDINYKLLHFSHPPSDKVDYYLTAFQ